MTEEFRAITVEPEEEGMRLDVLVSRRGLAITRSQVEILAKTEKVRVNGRAVKAGRRMVAGQVVEIAVPLGEDAPLRPEAVELDLLFEDDQLLVVNKPQGMVVHAGPGHRTGTLVNALLARAGAEPKGGLAHRPGIVHRLDRDTSGLLVVAKSERAYAELSRQVRVRELERHYLALAWGRIASDRLIIDVPLGRHMRDRKRMAAVPQVAPGRRTRAATTDVRVLERFDGITLVEARLATGRTHQIRVHLAHQGHPVVGDRTYGLRRARQGKALLDAETLALVSVLPGQALHAHVVRFRHPVTGQDVTVSAPAPPAMNRLLAHLTGAAPWRG